jgi:hypothetical protein
VEVKEKMKNTQELIHQRTKEYIKEIGGNVKSGFCYNSQARKYYERKQKIEAERQKKIQREELQK